MTATRGVSAGAGAGGPLGDVLFMGLAGVLVGALSAESYRLAEPRGSRAASLGGHPNLAFPGLVLTARVLIALAILLSAARPWLVPDLLTPGALVAAPLVGVVLVAVGEATRAAIANRRRPLLSAAAAEVDGRIRAYASASAARLELSAAALTAASSVDTGLPWLILPGLGLFLLAVVQLVRAKPRPPRGFVPEPAPEGAPV